MEFPYQIVAFLKDQPDVGDFIYHGSKGWLPHLAIKRRFAFDGTDQELILEVSKLLGASHPFEVTLRTVIRPAHMPVEVIEVEPSQALSLLHNALFKELSQSKYPNREGYNFFPHVTISWKGNRVFDPAEFENTQQLITGVWLLKDDGDDSRALASFKLGQ